MSNILAPAPIYATRTPEPEGEIMTPAESEALAGWQSSPTGRGVYAALAQHILGRVQAAGLEVERLISVGEGHGRLAWELASRLPAAQVVGRDLCPQVVAAARARHSLPNLRYERASVYEPAGGDADVVVCAFSFHHFEDPRRALRAMWSQVRDPGLLYLMDLRRDAARPSFRRRLEDYAQVAPVVARLFEQSVRAAYTTAELAALVAPLAPAGSSPTVGPVRMGLESKGAFLAADPGPRPSWPEVVVDTGGLWVEAVLSRNGHPA